MENNFGSNNQSNIPNIDVHEFDGSLSSSNQTRPYNIEKFVGKIFELGIPVCLFQYFGHHIFGGLCKKIG